MFTGREYLYTLGLYDYRHRPYHPGLGRFIQTDPIGFAGDPMNLYRYCGSNPINHSDPMGLNPYRQDDDGVQETESGFLLQPFYSKGHHGSRRDASVKGNRAATQAVK